jgi:hypothetical protein
VIDEELSRGLIAYVGSPGVADGTTPDDRLAATGPGSHALKPRITAVMDGLNGADPPLWRAPSVADVKRQTEHWLHLHHPELSDDAVTAVDDRFSYEWR